MLNGSKPVAFCALAILIALYVVGAVSIPPGSLRHEVQPLPLWFCLDSFNYLHSESVSSHTSRVGNPLHGLFRQLANQSIIRELATAASVAGQKLSRCGIRRSDGGAIGGRFRAHEERPYSPQ